MVEYVDGAKDARRSGKACVCHQSYSLLYGSLFRNSPERKEVTDWRIPMMHFGHKDHHLYHMPLSREATLTPLWAAVGGHVAEGMDQAPVPVPEQAEVVEGRRLGREDMMAGLDLGSHLLDLGMVGRPMFRTHMSRQEVDEVQTDQLRDLVPCDDLLPVSRRCSRMPHSAMLLRVWDQMTALVSSEGLRGALCYTM